MTTKLNTLITRPENTMDIASLDSISVEINVYDLLPILRLANMAADSATSIDKSAYAQIWSDLRDATGWEDEELAENILDSEAQP